MTTNVPKENYPFSTKDGMPIPLDVLRSKSLVKSAFTPSSDAPITIPAGINAVILYASENCVLSFGTADGVLADDTNYPNTIFIPRNHALTFVVLEGDAFVRGISTTGTLYVQVIERWAGVAPDVNYGRI